jgi:hypothetical protein
LYIGKNEHKEIDYENTFFLHRLVLFEEEEEEEEEELQPLAGVNKVSVRRTSLAMPQGSGVGCNTTSPFSGSRHYVGNYFSFTGIPVAWALEWGVLGLSILSKVL